MERVKKKDIIFRVDEEKRYRLKVAVAKKETSISAVMNKLLDKWLKENERTDS